MDPKGRAVAVMVLCGALLLAAPACASDNPLLKAVDTAMQNYAKSFYDAGSPGDIAEQWFRGGPKKWFSLKEMDTTMKAYADANQKVGEQAMTDLKACLKSLLDIRTYLPGPLRAAWEAMVAELGTLKARFLARAQNPWADDGGGGGSAALDVANDTPPTDSAVPTSGELPGDARASTVRTQSKKGAVDVSGMTASFEEFVGVRKDAAKGIQMLQGVEASKRQKAQGELVKQAYDMEDLLVAKLAGNAKALKALSDYVDRVDGATAKGCFTRLASRLQKLVNAAAVEHPENRALKAQASSILALKNKINGK